MAHIVPLADQTPNSVFLPLPLPAGRTEVRWPLDRNLLRELQPVAQWLGFAGPKRTLKRDLVPWIAQRLRLVAGPIAAAERSAAKQAAVAAEGRAALVAKMEAMPMHIRLFAPRWMWKMTGTGGKSAALHK